MKSKWIFLMCIVIVMCANAINSQDTDEENEFAEFENFDEEEFENSPKEKYDNKDLKKEKSNEEDKPRMVMAEEAAINEAEYAENTDDDDEEATVEDDDEEFEHFKDDSEFEGFESQSANPKDSKTADEKPEDLKISSIPLHLRTNWDSYYLEILLCAGIIVYMLNFVIGKSKNARIAKQWFDTHAEQLNANFHVVGDNGTGDNPQRGELMKESEYLYSLFCSGRRNCKGMLITMRLLKRQDLISTISRIFKPVYDQVTIKVIMEEKDMDNYVFCLGKKKSVNKLHKDMNDLNVFCNDKKSVLKYSISSQFILLNEINEVASSILDPMMISAINRYEEQIEYIHISDQYSGSKIPDDGSIPKQPETEKALIFCFNIGKNGRCDTKQIEFVKPLLQMVFHCIDASKHIRLTREGKTKSDKARQTVNDLYAKATHNQRSEEAQLRREKKRKEDDERMMNENDPEKQRRLEEKNNKRDSRKKKNNVKMMKIKSM